jgi:hypothetical protein
VQGWAFWQQQHLPVALKTLGLINGRAGSVELQQQAAQHSLTQMGCFIHQQGFLGHSRVLARASCGERQCYRVVTVSAIRQAFSQQRDALLCPAHQNEYANYSQHVTIFFNMLQQMGYQGVVVWDWHDVPEHPHMHWDVTIFLQGIAHRFEIDGPVHELRNGNRPPEDIAKDSVVKENPNHSLLRLSFHDNNAWYLKTLLYLQGRLQNIYNGVWATPWYLPFMGQGHGMVGII